MPKTAEIETLVTTFSRQLEQVARRQALEKVVEVLNGQIREVPQAFSGRRAAGPQHDMSLEVVSHITAHPSQRAEHIASALHVKPAKLRPTMLKLIAEKKIAAHGKGRGMTYTVI